jgi:hypothetical protein
VLQVGTLGALGIALPQLLRADARRKSSQPRSSADACILIFLNGGPSHLDMWDMKPDAPVEVRGEFKPIASSLPGVPLSEHLPRLAQQLHRCALVRSVRHSVNNAHAAAVYTALTGHDRGDANSLVGAAPHDYPALGSVLGVARPPTRPIVPAVTLPYITKEGRGGPPQPGYFAGLLGKSHDPLFVLRDPNAPDFSVPELTLPVEIGLDRLERRQELRRQIDAGFVSRASVVTDTMDEFQRRAFGLLSSAATQQAFQMERESAATRDAYGRNIYGQSVLLARRLIEAGTRVACISWAPDANATWDTHGNNFRTLKDKLLPHLDMAVSSLLNDLDERGLLNRTLVAVMGEFGRSPKVNAAAGRDHWNFCYSLMLAGGGIRPGTIFGRSDRTGGQPADRMVSPADVVATLYAALGAPTSWEFVDITQRPYALVPWGSVIHDLLI